MNKKEGASRFSIKYALIMMAIFSPMMIFVVFKIFERRRLLTDNSFSTLAVIEYLSPYVSKGVTSRKDLIYFYYIHEKSVIHKIGEKSAGAIKSLGIQVGDVYPITVVKSDSDLFEILYSKKIDTLLLIEPRLNHKYESNGHREFMNQK